MNRLLFIFLFSLLSLSCSAQKGYKLLERCPQNKPKWMSEGARRGSFFIHANKMPTLEEAQNAVMASLLNNIASSVAVQVVGETLDKTDWTKVELDGKTREEFIQTIEKNTTTKIAKMPALQGISLSKAETYWEKYRHRKTKEICFDYYILYPFSEFDLQNLIDAYNANEKAIDDKIDSYRNELNDIDDIDLMLENVIEIKKMKQEYQDDYVRYNKLDVILSLYDKKMKDIHIEVVENYNDNDKGTLVIQLLYDEMVMKTKSLPQLRSACARDFDKKHSGDKIILNFNTFDCYEQDDNYVEIRFTFGNRKLIKKVNINL